MRQKRKGFTLVELLVVIGIIALLISILLPTLSKARKSASNIKCLSNVRQLGIGFQLYLTDNKGVPFIEGTPAWSETGSSDPHFFWMYTVGKYVTQISETMYAPLAIVNNVHQPMFACPEAPTMENSVVGSGNMAIGYARGQTGWWASRPNWMGPANGTYGFNNWLYYMPGSTDTRYWERPGVIKGGDSVPIFVDCAWAEIQPSPTDAPPPSMSDPYIVYRGGGAAPSDMAKAAMSRHPGPSVNVAFMDGSARSVKVPQLWTLNWYNGYVPPTVLPIMPKN